MASSFVITSDTLRPKLRLFPFVLESTLAAFCSFQAPQVEAYAKKNAPWTDRTGNARNGLTAQPFGDSRQRGVVLFHTMPYGIWLEVRHSGRYAIINPTILAEGRRMMRELRSVLRDMP